MFNKNSFLAAALLAASTGTAAFAQQNSPAPIAPQPVPRIERQMQIFTADDTGGGYLGVQSQDVTKENFSKFGLREVRGVAVEKVLENSPAARAGLQAGDVIVKVDGEQVTSAKKLTRLISEIAPDHQAKITVLRASGERDLTATIGKRPAANFQPTRLGQLYGMPGIPDLENMPLPQIRSFPPSSGSQPFYAPRNGSSSRQIGVGITPLNNQLGDYFGIADGKGVLINSVAENSPAAKAGLKAGDVIVEIDGKTVGATLDMIRAVNEKKEGDVTLTIVRNKDRQTIRVTPEKMSNTPQNFMYQNDETPNVRRQQQLQKLMSPPDEDEIAPKLQRRSVPRVQ